MVAVGKKANDGVFGRRLREIRESRGLTQAALGEATGMKATAIGRLETGDREPAWVTIVRLADALGVKLDDFRGEVTTPEPTGPRPASKRK